MTVSLLNYGLGNLGSVANMFKRIGTEVRVVSDPSEIASSDRVLLPGVGAFDHGMTRLKDGGFIGPLRDFAASGKPFLGICLGMQLLSDSSEEGDLPGLGLIAGRSHKFDSSKGIRIPHMGWNAIQPTHSDPFITGAEEGSRFYFVHSFHVVPENETHVLAHTQYGGSFVSMMRSENVIGAQFHPEKSHLFGMTLLRNFSSL